jgi:hypothetical protein
MTARCHARCAGTRPCDRSLGLSTTVGRVMERGTKSGAKYSVVLLAGDGDAEAVADGEIGQRLAARIMGVGGSKPPYPRRAGRAILRGARCGRQ